MIQKESKLRVKVYESRQEMGRAAAEMVADRIRKMLLHKKTVNMIFAAAPSQVEMLEHLSTMEVDWQRVQAFHMDEYMDLAEEAPQRFGTFLKHCFFDHVSCGKVFYIQGNAADAVAECNRYSSLIKQYLPDIVCMGIGENGHLAFNDPPVADFNDPLLVKLVNLDAVCRQQQVNDGCFTHLDEVPLRAVTLTIPALLSASFISCVVPGYAKAKAVFNTLYQSIETAYPSSVLRTHADAVLWLDRQSAAMLGNITPLQKH